MDGRGEQERWSGGRGGQGGRGRGGYGSIPPHMRTCCQCPNGLGPSDLTLCGDCRVRYVLRHGVDPAASVGVVSGLAGTLTQFSGSQLGRYDQERGNGREGEGRRDREERREMGERRLRTRSRSPQRQQRDSRPRQRQPAQNPALDHLTAPPGRVVPVPCRICLGRDLQRAAENHFYHQCKSITSQARRQARIRFEAEEALAQRQEQVLLEIARDEEARAARGDAGLGS